MPKTTVWSRAEVGRRILAGETLIIYQGHLLRISQIWLDAHPGGNLALLHFVGRDATDEIEANHHNRTLKLILNYSIGHVAMADGFWEPFLPPICSGWVREQQLDGVQRWQREAAAGVGVTDCAKFGPTASVFLVEVIQKQDKVWTQPIMADIEPPPSTLSMKEQARHSKAYRELHRHIIDAGLYKCRYISGYGPEVLRYCALAGLSITSYRSGWFITSSFFLGLFWHQIVFSAHDLGHMGVTHNWTIDRIISIVIADWITGLSIGWWVQV